MYTQLSEKKLRSGESMEVGVVLAPDDRFADAVKPLLGHKPANFQRHLDEAFADRILGLETRFYLGLLNDRPICNIMTVEYNGVGILGHVFTTPDHRRKGACRLVMTEQMSDFKNRNGRFLTLGTGFDTHPYWIYHSYGFRSVIPKSGHMKYAADENFERDFFKAGDADVVEPDWREWPILNVLCAQAGLPILRNIGLHHIGPQNFEGGYLTMMENISGDVDHQARLLMSEHGAVTGYATLMPDPRWHGEVMLLDFFVHPAFAANGHTLLESVPLPDTRKIQCFTESDADWKIAALLEEGFDHEATLRGQLHNGEQRIDVEIYERSM